MRQLLLYSIPEAVIAGQGPTLAPVGSQLMVFVYGSLSPAE